MSYAEISIPEGWDIPFLLRAGATFDHSVSDVEDGKVRLQVHAWDLEKASAAAETYPVDYLAVLLPKKLVSISAERDRRILAFSFNGVPLPLDDGTLIRLDGAALGLMRNTDVTEVHWSLGGGEFVALPRDVMLAIADGAFRHVQKMFSKHRDMATAAKAAKDIHELALIDEHADASWR